MASAVEIHNNEANGSRLSRLLVNKGTEALRAAFNSMHRPSQLASVLKANEKKLKKLRYKVINPSQWKLLYPPSGSPDSQNFDVTLLTILLRNICGLAFPATGWDDEPPDSDTSVAANIARIKFYRNTVHAHITTTEIPDNEFENLWQKISQALEGLGTPKSVLDELKDAPLSPEEDDYIEQLVYWYKKEAELVEISSDTNAVVKDIQAKFRKLQIDLEGRSQESNNVSEVDKLAKYDFSGEIRCHNKLFLPGTRKWLFDELDTWFDDKDSDSTVMILTAGPGVGKSVFAAKVCQIYAEREQLAACHFCKYNNSDYRNPRMIIESLASNMCDNVNGFNAKLSEQLNRGHSKNTLSDIFRVLLNDPLHALEEREPMLLVIDALDESQVDSRSEFLELISEEFPKLPQWIKILITSRPELPVQEKLQDFNPVVITHDSNSQEDLVKYLRDHLSAICDSDSVLQLLAWQCKGSFLFAYHAQMELKKSTEALTEENLSVLVPKGISGFYEKQFKRLRNHLCDCALSEFNLKSFLQVLVAAKGPLPLSLLPECLGFPGDTEYEMRRAINEVMSTILPVYDDCLVVYHKSLVDWLTSDGFKEHAFTVDLRSGHECLWRACKKVFNDIVSRPSSELKATPLKRYALAHGISHMIQTADEDSYDWSVNVKLVHSRLAINRYPFNEMIDEWLEICKNSSLNRVLLHELRWHIRHFKSIGVMYKNCACYLQSVANRIDLVENDCDKRATARALLKEGRYFWFEDLNATALTKRFSFSVPLRTDVACIDVTANKQLVAVGCEDGWISIFKLPNFEELRVFDTGLISRRRQQSACQSTRSIGYYKRVDLPDSYFGNNWSCALSPLGNRLVTCEYRFSAEMRLWDVTSGNCLQRLKDGEYVDYCHFSECGLFILASSERGNYCTLLRSKVESLQWDEREKHESFTAWNAITLERVDRRFVVRKSTCDMCPLPERTQCLFPVTLKYSAHTSCYHWHDCIFYHTGAKLFKLSILDQLENMDWFLNNVIIGCRCLNLYARNAVSTKGQGLYLVPSFSYLNIFNITHQSYSGPYISHLCSIECCCSSPDGSFLATCVNGGPLDVLVWDAKLCKIVQVIRLPLWSAPGCWWSERCFWIYDGDLVKIPVSKGRTLDPSGLQRVKIKWKPIKLLTLSDVLIFVDEMNSTNVIGIIDGMVQYVEKLPIDESVTCAAVSHCNSIILAASPITIYIFKEVRITDSLHWKVLNVIHVDDGEKVGACCPFFDKCLITSDCTKGVLTGEFIRTFLILVDLKSGKITKKDFRPEGDLIYAGNSFYITQSNFDHNILARDLTSGQVIAKWRVTLRIGEWWSKLLSTRGNIIAVIFVEFGRVLFLKLRVPEQ